MRHHFEDSVRLEGHSPSPNKMPPPIFLHQRFRRRQTDQSLRIKLRPRPLLRRPILNAPTTRRIDTQHRHFRLLHSRDDIPERISDFTFEAEAEDGVDDMIGLLKRGGKVFGEWDVEI